MSINQWTSLLALSAVLGFSACTGEKRPTTDGGTVGVDAGEQTCSLDDPYTHETPSSAPLLDDDSSPNLGCATETPIWPESIPVAMGGCLDVFGVGSSITATTLRVAVYDAAQNPATDSPNYGETDVETNSPEAVACPKGAYYRIENIPTSTPLMVKVFDSDPRPSMVVVDSLQYNVILNPADIEIVSGDFVNFEANVIYSATYQSLPVLAGRPVDGMQDISDGVGRGVIAGEAHDCDGKVMKNIVIDGPCFDGSTKRVYTVGPDCDQPDPRLSTGPCGTYVYLNVEPGLHRVEGFYQDGTSTQRLGSIDLYVFPDAVTIFTPKGLDPIVQAIDAGMTQDAATDDANTNVDASMNDAAVDDANTNVDASIDDATVDDANTNVDAGMDDATVDDASVIEEDAAVTDANSDSDAGVADAA